MREQLDYAHSLARLRDAELQELRARVGRAATGCCAAMCGVPSWSSESGELVALPNCEHCLHSDCLLQLLTPYCPQCRRSVAKSPEAKTHLAINSDFIIRDLFYFFDESQSEKIVRKMRIEFRYASE